MIDKLKDITGKQIDIGDIAQVTRRIFLGMER
jgi:hypothetical protein